MRRKYLSETPEYRAAVAQRERQLAAGSRLTLWLALYHRELLLLLQGKA